MAKGDLYRLTHHGHRVLDNIMDGKFIPYDRTEAAQPAQTIMSMVSNGADEGLLIANSDEIFPELFYGKDKADMGKVLQELSHWLSVMRKENLIEIVR